MLVDAPLSAGSIQSSVISRRDEEASLPATTTGIRTLTLVIFWLLVMEGALRKWVAPHLSHILFFVRDPFLLLLYWKALRAGAFRNAGPWLIIGLAFAGIAPLLALAQIVSIGDTQVAAVIAYGWRQYFLYLPLPFALASTLDRDFLWRFTRHAFLAAILTAPLMFAQFHSPSSSVINRGAAEDEAFQFKAFSLINDKIRPSGFFTSTVGIGNLVPSTLALLLAAWLTPAARRKTRTPTLLVTAAAVASCLALSGSRGAFVAAALVVLSSFLLGMLLRDGGIRNRALFVPAALLIAGALLYPILFPEAFSAMLERVASAAATEGQGSGLGIFGRALYETVDFIPLLDKTPLVGFGLGLGGNGRSFLGEAGNLLLQNIYVESDWARHVVDLGPIVGVLFILYRIGLTTDLLRRTMHASRVANDPFPLLLFGYVGIGVFYGQLTGHGTVGGFLWLYLGLTLASCRTAIESTGNRSS